MAIGMRTSGHPCQLHSMRAPAGSFHNCAYVKPDYRHVGHSIGLPTGPTTYGAPPSSIIHPSIIHHVGRAPLIHRPLCDTLPCHAVWSSRVPGGKRGTSKATWAMGGGSEGGGYGMVATQSLAQARLQPHARQATPPPHAHFWCPPVPLLPLTPDYCRS